MSSRAALFGSFGLPGCAVALGCLSQGCGVDDRLLSTKRGSSISAYEDGGIYDDSGRRRATEVRLREAGVVNYDPEPAPHAEAGAAPKEDCLHVVDGVPDCANTLAQNADFNTGIAKWDPSNLAELRWVAKDSQDAKGSGSIAVKNATAADLDGLGEVAATQCLEIVPKQTYDYQASVYIKRGQVDYGSAQLGVWFYERPKCEGLVQAGGAYAIGSIQATNDWFPVTGSLAPLESSISMSVRLIVQKPFQSDPLEVLFDAIRITRRPSLAP